MQLLSLIPECTILVSSKEEGNIAGIEDADRLVRTVSNLATIPVIFPVHEHATRYREITRSNVLELEYPGDIGLTRERRTAVAHVFADCAPVLFIDRKQKAMSFAHAGWKGLTTGIVQVATLAMEAKFGTKPEDLWVWIGPCIQKDSYAFDDEPIQTKLETWTPFIEKKKEKFHIDLPGFITNECDRFGIDPTRVINDGRDTFVEKDIFYSHRRYVKNKEETDKGNFAVICWLN